MKKFFKWTGIILGGLILVIVIILFSIKIKAEKRLSAKFSVEVVPLVIPTDSASIERGKHWANLCTGCHRYDFAGKEMFNDPKLAIINTPNLTSGKGGIGSRYTDKDWLMAVRHGIRPDGSIIIAMPSKDFFFMSEQDFASLIAYLKTVPPVDLEHKPCEMYFMGKVLLGVGAFGDDIISAEVLDHSKGFEPAPPLGPTAEFGDYLVKVTGCRTCHGPDLTGGQDPNPKAPPAPDLSSKGNPGKWNLDEFTRTIRTGTTPSGKSMNPEFMPWDVISKYNDTEIAAIYTYLRTLPGKNEK